ncbi:hypothetical protein OR1_03421 [Geobacter sp. OR-1]|uniref:hypothetical protein n=1 Tax=Geobacter sp. OR-1 TaxID=1266765 RepID=UPI0005429898|nr:hypothetical protein [Geobacter sp. OR-1]GAM11112.1 hypothetical protein OR1_03421 [Geobacter sp. OR-1]
MKLFVLSSVLLLIMCSLSFADDTTSIREVVNAYIKYDMNGERLSTERAKNIYSIVYDNSSEAAWDYSVLVTGYKITKIKTKGKTAEVIVIFKNAWKERRLFDVSHVSDETITINLIKIKNKWKIAESSYTPHVSANILLDYYIDAIKEDAAQAGKEWVAYTQNRIKNIEAYRKLYKYSGEQD